MEYTYKGLKNIVREAERKLKAGTLDMEQAQIAAAAAHLENTRRASNTFPNRKREMGRPHN